jgi:hypothetical protein
LLLRCLLLQNHQLRPFRLRLLLYLLPQYRLLLPFHLLRMTESQLQ